MRKWMFLFFLILFCFSSKAQQEKINVLFIGNSMTYYHNMPKMLQEMLNETYTNYNIEQSTFPGMTLDSHLEDIIIEKKDDNITTREKQSGELTETEKKIASKKWDIVILQESPGCLYFPEAIEEIVNPSIQKIKKLVDNPRCKFILFNTWASEEKYPAEIKCIPKMYLKFSLSEKETFCSEPFQNLEKEVELLTKSTNRIAIKNEMILTNHCKLHYKIRKEFPGIKLYDDDDAHPSEAGAFLNACVFYKALTNNNLIQLKFHGNLNLKDAQILKKLCN